NHHTSQRREAPPLPQKDQHMTISTSASSVTIGGNGVNTTFNFGFVAGQASNLVVIYTDADGNETTLTPSQYSVTINPPAPGQIWGVGGTVTYPLSGTPIASGTTITIERIVPYTQLVSISNQGDFYPAVVEKALDTLEMQIQQVSASQPNAISAPIVDINPQMTLPPAAARAGQFVGFDPNGNVIAATPSGGGVPISAAMQPVVEASTLSIARQTLAGNKTLDDIATADWQQGDVMYYNGTDLVRLGAGTNSQVLTTAGTGANPSWGNPPTVIGTVRNLTVLQQTSTTATVTADEIMCKSALGGTSRVIAGLSVVLNIATTGANGMDTGSPIANSDLALYAIAGPGKPDAVLATVLCNGSVYTGSYMPAGYTTSALIGSYKTNANAQLGGFTQIDRTVYIRQVQVFSSSGSFLVPASVTSVYVTVIGGGGGGGYGGTSNGGAGGGGGGRAEGVVTGLTPGNIIPVTVGAAGVSGTSGSINGTAGGSSSFGSHISATGGAGGPGNSGNGASGGTGSGGALNITGQNGCGVLQGSTFYGGYGGGVPGFSLSGTFSTNVGSSSVGPGAGGGGGANGNNGANGQPGLVIVIW
ncbi:MAG TPA: hypothetical protein VHA37_09865, partial [Candidatus Saccharimonadales bacterium]|nr:hypothetical protein [Candidatus Saccharimonadales bacterium]